MKRKFWIWRARRYLKRTYYMQPSEPWLWALADYGYPTFSPHRAVDNEINSPFPLIGQKPKDYQLIPQ